MNARFLYYYYRRAYWGFLPGLVTSRKGLGQTTLAWARLPGSLPLERGRYPEEALS